jgi:hypothetical protein
VNLFAAYLNHQVSKQSIRRVNNLIKNESELIGAIYLNSLKQKSGDKNRYFRLASGKVYFWGKK